LVIFRRCSHPEIENRISAQNLPNARGIVWRTEVWAPTRPQRNRTPGKVRLEIERGVKLTVGSNPTPSAASSLDVGRFPFFFGLTSYARFTHSDSEGFK
jgi:hypothetical protein